MKHAFKTYSISVFYFLVSLFLLNSFPLLSQNRASANFFTIPDIGYKCQAIVIEGDTFPFVNLDAVDVVTDFVFKTRKQKEQWTRTKFNVKKVYPYAILAAAKLKEYDFVLQKIEDKQLRKAFIRVCEKDLRDEFEDELKGLSVSQGKVLMKLIDREANKTTYEIVKQMRGSFQAAMWQTLACLFGNSMKVEYDALAEDIMIERAVKLVENGQF
jgi:hypothetical protein